MLKPYYETELGKLYHGDCLEILPQLTEQVDLVLTDPPYGKQWARGLNAIGVAKEKAEKRENLQWDKTIPPQKCFQQMSLISKNQIIFGGNYFAHLLKPSNCWLVWDKKGDIAFQNPFADCELAYTTFNKPVKKYSFKQQGFIRDSKDKVVHPTQKPSELFCFILRDFTKSTDLVLDPFLGSGTTAVACERLDRRWVGIEISKEYCDIAVKRIEAERAQFKLFKGNT